MVAPVEGSVTVIVSFIVRVVTFAFFRFSYLQQAAKRSPEGGLPMVVFAH